MIAANEPMYKGLEGVNIDYRYPSRDGTQQLLWAASLKIHHSPRHSAFLSIDEETEAQRVEVTAPTAHSW